MVLKDGFNLGHLSFQPSELTKYAVVLFLAMSIDIKGDGIKRFLDMELVPYLRCMQVFLQL